MPVSQQVSIIIPTLNEERVIAGPLKVLAGADCEVIVADGGSSDNTVSIAEEHGARIIGSEPGRGKQLNLGAAQAGGDILFFLHADTFPPENFRSLIMAGLAGEGVVAGAFGLGIDAPGPWFRLLERGAAWRSSVLGLPYGDQGLFLSRKVFEEVRGYPDTEMMEDVGLIRRLKAMGEIILLPEKVLTSDRRWSGRGILPVTLLNQLLLCAFFLGIPPRFLARLYYGRKDI